MYRLAVKIEKEMGKFRIKFTPAVERRADRLDYIRRTLNAQGRTETRYNVVPRCVLFHVIYRLNREPKKKQRKSNELHTPLFLPHLFSF